MKIVKPFSIMLAAALFGGGFAFQAVQAAQAVDRDGLRAQIRGRVAGKLNLSREQRQQIKSILQADRDALAALFRQLHDSRATLRDSIKAPDATEASVRVAAARIAAVEADFAVERLKLYSKISPVLTADQREKLKAMQGRIDDAVDRLIDRIGGRQAK